MLSEKYANTPRVQILLFLKKIMKHCCCGRREMKGQVEERKKIVATNRGCVMWISGVEVIDCPTCAEAVGSKNSGDKLMTGRGGCFGRQCTRSGYGAHDKVYFRNSCGGLGLREGWTLRRTSSGALVFWCRIDDGWSSYLRNEQGGTVRTR